MVGVLARDNHLTSQVKARERRILAEFPTVAELLALAVAAGESPVAALDRVVRRSRRRAVRATSARVLADVRTGEPVASAFDRMAATTGLPLVARFAQGIAVAVERGTPLADVLHAQAADVREAGRRELIEVAARREVAMMVPGRVPRPAGHRPVRVLARRGRACRSPPLSPMPLSGKEERCTTSTLRCPWADPALAGARARHAPATNAATYPAGCWSP